MNYILTEYANAIKREIKLLVKANVNYFINEDKIYLDLELAHGIYYRYIIPDAIEKMASGVTSKTIATDLHFNLRKYIEKMYFN